MFDSKLPVFLAAGAIPQYMTEVVALIVARTVIAYICFRLKLVPIVGFLLAGVLIEPNALPEEAEAQMPSHAVDLEDQVIVAGYGQAARALVRVLNGSGIPYIITTLSPDGANEAEA